MSEYTVYLVLERGDVQVTDEHVITFEAKNDAEAKERFDKIRIKAS